MRGPANAAITLIEYADYECPYCQQIQPVVERLEAEYKGKMAFVFKDWPLPMHRDAEKAAEASRCAEAQGKYWEYHDTLMDKKQLDLAALKNHARNLRLNAEAFDKCLDGGETAKVVDQLSMRHSLWASRYAVVFYQWTLSQWTIDVRKTPRSH